MTKVTDHWNYILSVCFMPLDMQTWLKQSAETEHQLGKKEKRFGDSWWLVPNVFQKLLIFKTEVRRRACLNTWKNLKGAENHIRHHCGRLRTGT